MPPARVAFYAATLGVLVLSARAVMVGPPPFGWSLVAGTAYIVFVLASVLTLRWRVFVDAVVKGPRGSRGVVLTFDDGPHPTWTPRVLEILESRGAKATFFVIARKAEEHPELVKAILKAGHSVGLHSYAHDRLMALRREKRVREDLTRGIAVLEGIAGERPVLFRPPIGHTNPVVARVVDLLDLVVVGWTVSGYDGVASTPFDEVITRVRRDLRDGIIVALHDAPERGERQPAVVKALPAILDAIKAENLDVVPLGPWVAEALGGPGEAGDVPDQSGADGSTTVKRAPPS